MKINGVIIKPSDKPVLHCGQCGRPYTARPRSRSCDCPPIKLRADVPAPVANEPPPDEPPPSGWRERPALL